MKKEEIESREYVPHGPVRGKHHEVKNAAHARTQAEAKARIKKADEDLAKLTDPVEAKSFADTAKTLFDQVAAAPTIAEGAALLAGKSAVDALVEAAGGKLTVENVRGLITQECDALCALLLEKNAAYGNSALDPVRLFSKASPVEQLLVRIDDKISRIARGDFTKVRDEDLKVVTKDLLGYLILIRVAWRLGLA